MRLLKAVFCVCALVAFGALSLNEIASTTFADPAQAKVDYSQGYPDKAPGSTHLELPDPMLLGDPKTSPEWGLDDTWGISKLTHQAHTEKYKIECVVCHHTNGPGNAALNEDVERCVNCHKAEGHEKNPITDDGIELNVKEAFHVGEAGCIECHKREAEKNANTTAPTTCAACHERKS